MVWCEVPFKEASCVGAGAADLMASSDLLRAAAAAPADGSAVDAAAEVLTLADLVVLLNESEVAAFQSPPSSTTRWRWGCRYWCDLQRSAGVLSQPAGQIGRTAELQERLGERLQLLRGPGLDAGGAAQPCQISFRSICSPGKREPASRLVAASMRWGSPPPLAGHTSTACWSGISSQPSWAPLAW
jgi:hypothetical protein